MLKLLKSELKYNALFYIFLGILYFSYTFFVLTDTQIITDKAFEIDYWGGIYGTVLILAAYAIWALRLKEKRIRFFALLPLSAKQLAWQRFWLAALPFFAVLSFIVILHLAIIPSWHQESGSMLGQTGVMFVLFAGFIRGRDDWFSHWDFGKRTQKAFIVVFIIQIVIIALFLSLPDIYHTLSPVFGRSIFYYAKIIFYMLGLAILATSIFSFNNRVSYLS